MPGNALQTLKQFSLNRSYTTANQRFADANKSTKISTFTIIYLDTPHYNTKHYSIEKESINYYERSICVLHVVGKFMRRFTIDARSSPVSIVTSRLHLCTFSKNIFLNEPLSDRLSNFLCASTIYCDSLKVAIDTYRHNTHPIKADTTLEAYSH